MGNDVPRGGRRLGSGDGAGANNVANLGGSGPSRGNQQPSNGGGSLAASGGDGHDDSSASGSSSYDDDGLGRPDGLAGVGVWGSSPASATASSPTGAADGEEGPALVSIPVTPPPADGAFLSGSDNDNNDGNGSDGGRRNEPAEIPRCPICLAEVVRVYETNCKHVFCSVCAAKWFETRSDCPLCRSRVRLIRKCAVEGGDVVSAMSRYRGNLSPVNIKVQYNKVNYEVDLLIDPNSEYGAAPLDQIADYFDLDVASFRLVRKGKVMDDDNLVENMVPGAKFQLVAARGVDLGRARRKGKKKKKKKKKRSFFG